MKNRTGEELYQLFVRMNAERGIKVDAWDDLTDDERCVWVRMAIELMFGDDSE